jgi:Uma2 family endonuclease
MATKARIGPLDHGRRMSLKAFEFARVGENHLYELARGYVVVSELATLPDSLVSGCIKSHLGLYRCTHPGRVFAILDGFSCKVLVPDWESERHPDIPVYLRAPARPFDDKVWRGWIPELVIEVVSEATRDRDYTQKRDEYWSIGVKEYWIVDPFLERVLILRRRRSRWSETIVSRTEYCKTKLLPGLKLSCEAIFEPSKRFCDN